MWYLSCDFVPACISFTDLIFPSQSFTSYVLHNRTQVLPMLYLLGFLLLCEVVGEMVLLDSVFLKNL